MRIHKIEAEDGLPEWASRDRLAVFLHETLKPYHDTLEDVQRGLEYAFSADAGRGGFVMLGEIDGELAAALVMLRTGMGGYVPENLLLFVGVVPERRGQGLGRALIEAALNETDGGVKLHVEHDNPARRLYERLGFTAKYAEMRLVR